jgi:tetratricopeptide (TPR) repeat protein
MRRGRQAIKQVIDSVADGSAEIDWGAFEQQVSNERDLDLLRQLRVLSQLSDFQRAEADRVDEAALKASAKAIARIGVKTMSARTSTIQAVPHRRSSETLPPRRWGRLELSERLGEGTFGEVYRAFDPTLEREVAVKLLHVGRPQARLARVLDEARALARVRHPNVVVVHDAEVHDGRVGLCMELIRGQTLSSLLSAHGKLGSTEATTIGQALCRALAAVHNEGLLHRDIKAQNVMREEGGRVVLMDFGAGQRLERVGQAPPRLTGTPLYLAPEVLEGGKATVQSDIYSLGVLLYHLVTNDYPVSGASLEELKDAHRHGRRTRLHDARPDLDDAFVAIVERAIDTDPTRRYQTPGELRDALGGTDVLPPRHGWTPGLGLRLAAATFLGVVTVAIGVAVNGGTLRRWLGMPVDTRHVIAVLPLDHTSDIEDYVAADVTDSLNQALSAVDGVIVLSRTSVKAARQANASLPQLAQTLGAQLVLEGRVSRAGNGLAASLNLVQAPRDHTLLARTFRFSLPAIERLQQDVLQAVCERLSIALDPRIAGRFGHTRRVRADARELYARGRFELAKLTAPSRAEALEYFKRATVADPEFALPYAGLAEAYAMTMQPNIVQESFELAERAAQQALALDPSLADAHAVLADIRMLRDWDWAMADAEFQKAIALAPSLPTGYRYPMLLAARGKTDQAVERIFHEQRLDPLSSMVTVSAGTILQYAGRFGEALEQVEKALRLEPGKPVPYFVQGRVLTALGRYQEARAAFLKARALGLPEPDRIDAELAAIDAAEGRTAAANEALTTLEARAATGAVDPTLVAFVHGRLGQLDAAFNWLDRAYAERSMFLVWIKVDPRFKPLARDPRFPALVKRMGLD